VWEIVGNVYIRPSDQKSILIGDAYAINVNLGKGDTKINARGDLDVSGALSGPTIKSIQDQIAALPKTTQTSVGGSTPITFNNNGTGLVWGQNSSKIYDDANLHVETDDEMYLKAPKSLNVNTPSATFTGNVNFKNDGSGLVWGQNYSKIYDNADLHIETDDNMFIKAPTSLNIDTPNATIKGNLSLGRKRLAFGDTTDKNHTIYNNALNVDGEGAWDGMKMNAFEGLDVRVGDANGGKPASAFTINTSDKSVKINGKLQVRNGDGGDWNWVQVIGKDNNNIFVGSDNGNRGIWADGSDRPFNIYNKGKAAVSIDKAGDTTVNDIKLTKGWTGYPDGATDRSEIANDVGAFKALMLVGNKSGNGSERKVDVWDKLSVHGNFAVDGVQLCNSGGGDCAFKTPSGYSLRLQNDGNLVVYNKNNAAVWASGTNGK
jgi:hypothetical protein